MKQCDVQTGKSPSRTPVTSVDKRCPFLTILSVAPYDARDGSSAEQQRRSSSTWHVARLSLYLRFLPYQSLTNRLPG